MKRFTALLPALLLVACGGSPTSGSLSEPLLITGVVAKGLMKQAKVEVFAVNADGTVKSTPLATGTTNSSSNPGYYSLVVPSYSGVLVVKASVGSSTRMIDEETQEEISPSSSFVMRTALAVQSGQSLKVNVNPFTESAVSEVEAGTAKFTEAAVRQANHQQAQVLSVDPVSSDSSFDPADRSKPASPLAMHLAAISKLAQDSSTMTSLGCASASNTATKVDCAVKAIREKKHMAANMRQTMNTALDSIRSSRQLPHIAAIVQAPVELAVDTSNRTPVQRLKTFIATLRSNAKSIDSNDNSLLTHYETLLSVVENKTAPATGVSLEAIELALKGVDLWQSVKVDKTTPFSQSNSFNNLYSGFSPAGCFFYQDAGYSTAATLEGNANYLECRTSPRREELTDSAGYQKTCLISVVDTSATNWCYQIWTTRLRIRADSSASNTFKVQSVTRSAKYIYFNGTTYKEPMNGSSYVGRTLYGDFNSNFESTVVYARDSSLRYTQASLTGYLAPGFKTTSESGSYYYGINSPCGFYWCYKPSRYEVLGDKHQVNLNTTLTGGYSSPGPKKLSFGGTINLIKNGFVESQIELASPSYIAFELNNSNQLVSGTEEASLSLKISSGGDYLSGVFLVNKFSPDVTGTDSSPTQVVFTGSLGLGGTEFFGLRLSGKDLNQANYNPRLPLSATNYRLRSLELQSKVVIPNRPALNLSVTALDKTADVSSGYLNVQYSQGSMVVNIFGAMDGIESTVDQMSFQTTDGISMTLTDNNPSLIDLFYQGGKVGQLDTKRSMLLYADGSFEKF